LNLMVVTVTLHRAPHLTESQKVVRHITIHPSVQRLEEATKQGSKEHSTQQGCPCHCQFATDECG
jgi:hypothetical protein